MSRKAPLSRSLVALAALSALAALPGCKEEDTRLFDENGVWSLSHFTNLDGDLVDAPLNTHENAFMLKFNSGAGVVATAACRFQGGAFDPNSSTCRIGDSDDIEWECRCFAYEFEEKTQRWVEFLPGETPPSVGSGDTDGDGSTTEVGVEEYEGVNNSYYFFPLPETLFGSNGVDTQFVFNGNKAASVFDESGCEQVCSPE